MKNLRVFFLFIAIYCFFTNNLYAFEYTEDNAVYWYIKAYDELTSFTKINGFFEYTKIYSLNDFNTKLTPYCKEKIKEVFPVFVSNLEKGKKLDKCFFENVPTNDSEGQDYQYYFVITKGFGVANTLAWYAISENKPDIAGDIWLNMLEISKNICNNNVLPARMFCGIFGVKQVLTSLDNYFKKDASENFKKQFVQYLKKWPKSIFDFNDVMKSQYNFLKTNIDFYGKNQKYLATLFGARMQGLKDDCKPEIIENQECKRILKEIEGGIEFYQMNEETGEFGGLVPDFSSIKDEKNRHRARYRWRGLEELRKKIEEYKKEAENQKDNPDSNNLETNKRIEKDNDDFGFEDEPEIVDYKSEIKRLESQIKQFESDLEKMGVSVSELEVKKTSDFPKMPFDEVVKILISNRNLHKSFDNYKCPENGKRTIELKNYGDESFYKITCDCGKEEDPRDDFKPDSKPMKLAKEYRNTLFETEKIQFFEYFDKFLKVDNSKPITDEKIKELDSLNEKPEYKNNVWIIWFGVGYSRNKKTFEENQKRIDDFIKTYDK